MDKDTQLPADVKPSNDLEIKIFNVLLNHSYANRTTAAKELAELFSAEYATKLHEAQQEIESLTNQLKKHADVSNENMKLLDKKYVSLQAKCDRLEGVLMEIENDSTQWFGHLKKPKDNPIAIRCREALSGKGDKEVDKPDGWPNVCHICGKQNCESDHK
jgi:hypothetical protein